MWSDIKEIFRVEEDHKELIPAFRPTNGNLAINWHVREEYKKCYDQAEELSTLWRLCQLFVYENQ